jgi:LCP family protein required for cell wall assembly
MGEIGLEGDEWNPPRQGELGAGRSKSSRPPVSSRRPPAAEDDTTEIAGLQATVDEPAELSATSARPAPARSRARPATRRRRRWGLVLGGVVLGLVSAIVLAGTGYAWVTYHNFDSAVTKSNAIDTNEPKSVNGDTNILIMGLDTRLDENGNSLPQNIYNELHAGDQDDGGENSNVLMLLHVPGDGSRATSISIPRDDYVAIPGCPDGQCHGKIKQAYGLAFDQESKVLAARGVSGAARMQGERDAARKEEVDTVRQFLGGVPIDHFIEVTLIAFFEIAQVVQPITVCVNEDTVDSYSGASFHKGTNVINASQALAFVRQRRDNVHPELQFTDLDRERRQQAFISSLAFQLRQAGTFTDPAKLSGILGVAKANIAIDDKLDLLSFAQQASNLTSGKITFYTLPVQSFGKDSAGEDVNIVNVPLIQSTVHSLLYPTPPATVGAHPSASTTTTSPPTTTTTPPPTAVVDVENASGQSGVAGRLESALARNGYTQGATSTDTSRRTKSLIEYGTGASLPAQQLSDLLGDVQVESSTAVHSGRVKVILGSDFRMPSALAGSAGSPTTPTTTVPPASAVAADSGGVAGPAPTQLSALTGGSIPCVK